MITVIKQNPLGETIIQYQGEIVAHLASGVIIEATWTSATYDLGYTRFETGDRFTEYFYTDRRFNIFAIATAAGQQKGWYCNIAEPAVIFDDRLEQIDLLLDVWVSPTGAVLILDEDEFAATTTLSAEQRRHAQHGLQALLQMIQTRQAPFSGLRDGH